MFKKDIHKNGENMWNTLHIIFILIHVDGILGQFSTGTNFTGGNVKKIRRQIFGGHFAFMSLKNE